VKRPLAVLAAAVLALGLASCAAAPKPGTTLIVHANQVLRPVTHVASGGLYGLATANTPDPAELLPLHPLQFTQPPPGVQQLGNGATEPTGDALKVAGTTIGVGAQTYVRMPDIYPDFPYRWVSWDDWLSKVDAMVDARLAATTITNIDGWELWNEPDWTWNANDAGDFNDGWARTYREVRSKDTITPIVGPSFSHYDDGLMADFLSNAKASNTVPNVMSWHELDPGPDGWVRVAADIADYRALEKSFKIGPLPISINEYAAKTDIDKPSGSLHFIAQFERGGVANADRAYWYESGTVGGLLYKNKPTGTYWLYKWYGDMTGSMVPVSAAGRQDGIASLDTSRKEVDVVFGGAADTNAVNVKGLALGNQVDVRLSSTPATGRHTNVTAPRVVSNGTYSVTDGAITVPISNQVAGSAYQLRIVRHGASFSGRQRVYEAEGASVVNGLIAAAKGASNGSLVTGLTGSGDARRDSFVDFHVTARSAGSYSLAIRYRGKGTQGIRVDDGEWRRVTYSAAGLATIRVPVRLHAGDNTIRLAKGSPGFAGGTGAVDLDSIAF
jgi:hypothetical protein